MKKNLILPQDPFNSSPRSSSYSFAKVSVLRVLYRAVRKNIHKLIIPAFLFSCCIIFGVFFPPMGFFGGAPHLATEDGLNFIFIGAVFRDSLWQTVVMLWLINQARSLP